MYEASFQEHLVAKRSAKQNKSLSSAPFQEERNAAASWHRSDAKENLDSILRSIQEDTQRPNSQQLAFLKHFASRLKVEVLEREQRTTEKSSKEPLLDLIHGFPGTGKSKVIEWMRRLMEEGLGWEHGVQFVCLAFQNAMAAQINGFTGVVAVACVFLRLWCLLFSLLLLLLLLFFCIVVLVVVAVVVAVVFYCLYRNGDIEKVSGRAAKGGRGTRKKKQ